jgi:hypothetical protein
MTTGFWTETLACPASRSTISSVRLFTKAAWRSPMGDISTISPRISSTRSSGLRIPTSAMR